MSEPPGDAPIIDISDLDGEDLACLGMRRADDFMDAFEDLNKQRKEQAWERYAALPKPFKPRKPSKPRKPNIRALIAQAKVGGVTAVTLPDGTKLDLGTPGTSNANPWDEVLIDAADTKRAS